MSVLSCESLCLLCVVCVYLEVPMYLFTTNPQHSFKCKSRNSSNVRVVQQYKSFLRHRRHVPQRAEPTDPIVPELNRGRRMRGAGRRCQIFLACAFAVAVVVYEPAFVGAAVVTGDESASPSSKPTTSEPTTTSSPSYSVRLVTYLSILLTPPLSLSLSLSLRFVPLSHPII